MMKKSLWTGMVIILAFVITGCGSSTTATTTNGASGNSQSGEVTKIIVGTGTAFPQVCFIDASGKLTGFDVELVRLIDEQLPQYEFELQTMEFSNLLLSLETKKIDIVAHEMEKNPEREQKFLFSKEPYAHWKNKIVVAKDNNASIKTLDDLKGKKVLVGATSAQAQIVENYNKANNNGIEIVYRNGAANDTVSQLITGRADAALAADFSLKLTDPQGKLKTTGKELSSADILFMFRKDDAEGQKLSDAIDGVIKKFKTDGTLGKLSQEWLGFDLTEISK